MVMNMQIAKALSLNYLDPFQQTAVFSDFVDTSNSAAFKACAEWLLFLGDDVSIVTMPDVIRKVIREKLAKFAAMLSIDRDHK
ncbi:hypothetical protein OENI_50096 [Oenococcus oeni]|nr:hypothetical protein OENI_50096 [Oenococcus oeni]